MPVTITQLKKQLKSIFIYLKDFKTSNVQHTNEVLPWFLGVKGMVDSVNQPVKHSGIQSFSQSSHSEVDLAQILTFGDPFRSDFNFGCQQRFQQVSCVDTN